jgi:hypothetical protein
MNNIIVMFVSSKKVLEQVIGCLTTKDKFNAKVASDAKRQEKIFSHGLTQIKHRFGQERTNTYWQNHFRKSFVSEFP